MKKQPKFEVDLIDFKRKNLWMTGIEKTKNVNDSVLKIVIIAFVLIWTIVVLNIWL